MAVAANVGPGRHRTIRPLPVDHWCWAATCKLHHANQGISSKICSCHTQNYVETVWSQNSKDILFNLFDYHMLGFTAAAWCIFVDEWPSSSCGEANKTSGHVINSCRDTKCHCDFLASTKAATYWLHKLNIESSIHTTVIIKSHMSERTKYKARHYIETS